MIAESREIESFDKTKLNITLVENGSPIWIIVSHGLGEHAGRHKYFEKHFSEYFNICRWDLRGHGKSGGDRASISQFSDFVEDLDFVINYLKENFKMKRYNLFAHSMGALITSSYMQKKVSSDFYPEKVFLSGPPVSAPGVLGKFFKLAPLKLSFSLSQLNQSIALGGMLDIKKLSHDSRVYEHYISDPLNSLRIETKLFFSILAESKEVFSKPLRVSCPLYVAVASEDKLIDPNAVEIYFKEIEKNSKLFVVEGGYHELHNEIKKFRDPYINFLKSCFSES